MKQYTVLLNDSLKKHILLLKEPEKRRLREKFEFLENGFWDAGVRVKKLKGVADKVIFEARLSKGDRILFTLGRINESVFIYIWGIVKHDNISRKAQNIFPDNAGFLAFDEETSLEAAEEVVDLAIENLKPGYFTQESIEEKAVGDYGPQKWLVVTQEEWERILQKPDPDNFEIHLCLTGEQAELVSSDPPLLLSGTAGSGKTTLSVYFLLKPECRDRNRLFLTYNQYLKRFSMQIYKGLTAKTLYEKEGKPPEFFTYIELLTEIITCGKAAFDTDRFAGLREFESIFRNHKLYHQYDTELIWEEIRSIIKGAKSPVSIKQLEILAKGFSGRSLSRKSLLELKDYLCGLTHFEFIGKIESILYKKTSYSSYEDFLVKFDSSYAKQENGALFLISSILGILEKHISDFSVPLLSYNEYLMLGKKRAPHFIYDRKDIYSIAEYYQEKLGEKKMFDEIDLTRQCISLLDNTGDRFAYDLVVCDEVQDFTDIQLSLIFRLCREHTGIVFSGDPKQIINPSGFRWEEVKQKFYERGVSVPGIKHLSLNFRCVGNIVKLSNALLDLKQKLIGISGSEMKEEWKFRGKPPLVIHGIDEDAVVSGLSSFAAGRIVIVRTAEELKKVKKLLNSELVFTINDAKGLEFDTVILWKFSCEKKSKDIWRRIVKGEVPDEHHLPHIRHEINLLYVAITRARNTLIIYDGHESADIWKLDLLSEHVYQSQEKTIFLKLLEHISSPREWEKQGDYFFDREYYTAAYECFKNSGNPGKTEAALAFICEIKKDFLQAAGLFGKYKNWERAAINYERCGDYKQALVMWEKAGDRGKSRLCSIYLLEKKGDYSAAGDEWAKLKNFERAAADWEKAGDRGKLGSLYKSLKQFDKASVFFEKVRMYDEAAFCALKAKQTKRAAELYVKAGMYQEAAKLYKKLKDTVHLAEILIKMKSYRDVALVYEQARDFSNAISYFRLFIDESKENRKVLDDEAGEFAKAKKLLKAAIRYSALGKYKKSGKFFMQKKCYDEAVKDFSAIGDHDQLAECYLRQHKYHESAIELEKTDLPDKWGKVQDLLEKYLVKSNRYPGKGSDKIEALFRESLEYEKAGNIMGAYSRYKTLNDPDGVYKTGLRLDKDADVLEILFQNWSYGLAASFIRNKKELHLSFEEFKFLIARMELYDLDEKRQRTAVQAIFDLINRYLDTEETEEVMTAVRTIIIKSHFHHHSLENMPQDYFTLLIRTRCYKTIIKILADSENPYLFRIKIPESFFSELKESAEKTDDRNLLACYYFHADKDKCDEICNDLPISILNIPLFAFSRKHYHKAVDFYTSAGNYQSAASVAKMNSDFEKAAPLYEQGNYFKDAAELYEKLEVYEKAVNCYLKAKKPAKAARIYEMLKEFDKALEIWKQMKKPNDIRRVEAEIRFREEEKTQGWLF